MFMMLLSGILMPLNESANRSHASDTFGNAVSPA
jgi:hypothetical protein